MTFAPKKPVRDGKDTTIGSDSKHGGTGQNLVPGLQIQYLLRPTISKWNFSVIRKQLLSILLGITNKFARYHAK